MEAAAACAARRGFRAMDAQLDTVMQLVLVNNKGLSR